MGGELEEVVEVVGEIRYSSYSMGLAMNVQFKLIFDTFFVVFWQIAGTGMQI